ncbi:hypothetical protein MMC13_003713 [Lambiella insularis]|nr:hypothetical protein [Lambiella insularis]
MKPTQVTEKTPASQMEAPLDGLHKLLGTSEYSDFTVNCGGKTWRIHRAIVCSRSAYFKKACDGAFKEAQEGLLVFNDEDPTLIEEMLMYLYTMDYPQVSASATGAKAMVLDAKMYGIADKYALPDLKKKAFKAFQLDITDSVSDPLFAEAADYVYGSTPVSDRGLRDLVKGTVWENRGTMLGTPEIQQCILKHGDFQSDILQALFKDPGTVGAKKEKKAKVQSRPHVSI